MILLLLVTSFISASHQNNFRFSEHVLVDLKNISQLLRISHLSYLARIHWKKYM